MRIEKNVYDEDTVIYDSQEEQMTAIRNYLDGNYGELTLLEIEYIRKIEKDPTLDKFAATHAGQIAADVEESYLPGMRFVFGDSILSVPHPITNWYLYHLELDLFESMDAEDLDFYKEMKGKENE